MNLIQNTIQTRNQRAAEKLEKKRIQIELATKLKDAGVTNAQIARLMEISESAVLSLFKQVQAAKISRYVDFKDMDRQSIRNIVDGWVMATGKPFLIESMVREWAEANGYELVPIEKS